MRLTAKIQYAVVAMFDLALHKDQGPRPLADISRHLGVSISYLEQLFAALRERGLVNGVRGPGGGYRLNRELDRISIADIICAVDDWVDYHQPNRKPALGSANQTTANQRWNELSGKIFDLTANITLYSLVNADESDDESTGHDSETQMVVEGSSKNVSATGAKRLNLKPVTLTTLRPSESESQDWVAGCPAPNQ